MMLKTNKIAQYATNLQQAVQRIRSAKSNRNANAKWLNLLLLLDDELNQLDGTLSLNPLESVGCRVWQVALAPRRYSAAQTNSMMQKSAHTDYGC